MSPKRCQHALKVEHCPTCSTKQLIHDLTSAADWLAASLLPGTAKSWRAPVHYEDRRTPEQVDQARLERLERVDVAPGETPPMLDFDVMDLLSEVLAEADRLSVEVVEAVEAPLRAWGGSWTASVPSMRLPDASSAFADPAPFLGLLHDLIEHVPDRDLIEHVAYIAHRLIERSGQTLGLVFDGQLLDAICPWCEGKTERHPIGGRRTLRVRMSQAEEPRPMIVCEGGRCEPGANSGEQWKGLPAWDLLNEGEWLGECIAVREGADRCRCGRPIFRTGKAGRPAAHCSEQCRREADAERQREQRRAS